MQKSCVAAAHIRDKDCTNYQYVEDYEDDDVQYDVTGIGE